MKSLEKAQVDLVIKILRKYFLNVYKMIFALDQKQADNFKARNTYYYEQGKQSKKEEAGHQCCSFFSKVYIPEKERSGLE